MDAFEGVCQRLSGEPRRWLVTGVAGFIGSHLLEALLDLDQEVVGLDNFATGSRANLDDVLGRVGPERAQRFEFIEGDIRDPAHCDRAMQGVKLVLHQAALGSVPRSMADPASTHRTNVDGFVNVLLSAGAARVERVVFASSSSVYGDHPGSPKLESEMGRPLSPYATSKLVDEIYADTLLRTHGIDSVGLRYFNVFGPRQDPNGPYAAVIPRWTQQLIAGAPCIVYGDGSTSRDFCFVKNVVRANLLAALATREAVTPRIFNIACGDRTTLLELFAGIQRRVAEHAPAARSIKLQHEPPRPGDIQHSLADIGRARSCLGYEPVYDVLRGLDQTISWYARADRSPRPLPAAPELRDMS
ncbi:MAG TPA: SDR family oxidoreductase [Polyangiaceae bacterium]